MTLMVLFLWISSIFPAKSMDKKNFSPSFERSRQKNSNSFPSPFSSENYTSPGNPNTLNNRPQAPLQAPPGPPITGIPVEDGSIIIILMAAGYFLYKREKMNN